MAKAARKLKSKAESGPRTSVSFAPDVYRTLEDIAKQKKVSLAWVVREAVDNYINQQWPLLSRRENP